MFPPTPMTHRAIPTARFGACSFSVAFWNGYKFTGKERDSESGLDNFGARYDSSSIGRFMSPDWSANPEAVPYSQLDNPQSLNLYGYVNNNPLSKADKDGHCPDACVIEGVSAGVVVGIATVGATAVYLSTPAGQRSLSTFTSAFSSSVSNSVDSIKNFFSSSSSSNPAPVAPTAAPAAPTGATPVPTTAPAAPGTQSNQPTSNPWTGQPGSQSQTAQPDGSPKQVRKYGPDGYPETDVDHGHDHGQGDPHAHDIGRPADGSPPTHTDRGPGRPVTPNDPKPQ
jgi:RHS repeat-associated protein